ncbi:hypothetical protein [Sphingomonas sp.]|jgi:hypothetical protein|uniref:hypothetical protein n=1 Tax=Sphingomonas sp. TaxID=28214 RepID=UPI0035C8566D
MTIEAMLIGGLVVGLLIGLVAPDGRVGCAALWIVPVGMIAYIAFWQWQHPEDLRSTSALDFLFGPLWPTLGACAGYAAGLGVRGLCVRKGNGS